MTTPCAVPDCTRDTIARGWCGPHYKRWWRWGSPEGGGRRTATRIAAALADVEWLAWSGECLLTAAERLGTTPAALERRLYRHRRGDLVSALKRGAVA